MTAKKCVRGQLVKASESSTSEMLARVIAAIAPAISEAIERERSEAYVQGFHAGVRAAKQKQQEV